MAIPFYGVLLLPSRGWAGMIITTYKTSYCPIYIMTTNQVQGRDPMGGTADINQYVNSQNAGCCLLSPS